MKMSIRQKIKIFLLIAVVFQSGTATAETILFKDGTNLRGKVIDQDQFSLRVKTSEGEIQSISKEKIFRVHYKDYLTPEEESAIREKELRLAKEKAEQAQLLAKSKAPIPMESAEISEEDLFIPPDPMDGKTAWGAFFRSLAVPGWGQFYQGRPIAGSVYAMLVVGGGYGLYEKNRIYQNAKNDFSRMKDPTSGDQILAQALGLSGNSESDPTRKLLEPVAPEYYISNPSEFLYQKEFSPLAKQQENVQRHFRERQAIAYGLGAVWIWNAIDAYIFHPSGSEESILGFQENLDRGNWLIGLDTQSFQTQWDNQPSLEHRLFFRINF